jgi:hypothetical protein
VEDILHFFTACPRVAAAWAFLGHRAAFSMGRPLTDQDLLFLAWPPSPIDAALPHRRRHHPGGGPVHRLDLGLAGRGGGVFARHHPGPGG